MYIDFLYMKQKINTIYIFFTIIDAAVAFGGNGDIDVYNDAAEVPDAAQKSAPASVPVGAAAGWALGYGGGGAGRPAATAAAPPGGNDMDVELARRPQHGSKYYIPSFYRNIKLSALPIIIWRQEALMARRHSNPIMEQESQK